MFINTYIINKVHTSLKNIYLKLDRFCFLDHVVLQMSHFLRRARKLWYLKPYQSNHPKRNPRCYVPFIFLWKKSNFLINFYKPTSAKPIDQTRIQYFATAAIARPSEGFARFLRICRVYVHLQGHLSEVQIWTVHHSWAAIHGFPIHSSRPGHWAEYKHLTADQNPGSLGKHKFIGYYSNLSIIIAPRVTATSTWPISMAKPPTVSTVPLHLVGWPCGFSEFWFHSEKYY